MPDLATHLTVAYLVNTKIRLKAPLILMGAVLPDISRALLLIFPYHPHHLAAFHTPLGTLVLIGLAALAFKPGERKWCVLSLAAGTATHYFLDLFQHHYSGGSYWFFPFSLVRYEIGLFGTEDSLFVLPVLLVVVGVLLWRRRSKGVKG